MLEDICRKFIVRAEKSRDGTGYVGIYGIPGKDEQYARDLDNADVTIFPSPTHALAGAGLAMAEAMNGRRHNNSKRIYAPMSGAELAASLRELQISPAMFAWLYGTTQKRVLKEWIDGTPGKPGQHPSVPHSARLLIELLLDEEVGDQNRLTAIRVTEQATERRPEHE